jgi:hypothetical protein
MERFKDRRGTSFGNPTDQSLCDQSDFVRSIAPQSITIGDQSCGFIGTIDRNAIDSKN